MFVFYFNEKHHLLVIFLSRQAILHSPGFPGTNSVGKNGLNLTEIQSLCLTSAEIKGAHHHWPAASTTF